MPSKTKIFFACILLMLLVLVSLLIQGCDEGTTVVRNDGSAQPAGSDTAQSPGQNQGTGQALQQNQTPAVQEQQPAAETEEYTSPPPYTLEKLNEFLPTMDYLIGTDAPSSDVLAVTNMKTYLIFKNVETGEAKLTNEVENYKKADYIIVGSPCSNPAAADMFSKDIAQKGSCKIFPDGEGVIKLKAVSNNHFMLYVGGNNIAETMKAMKVVQYFSNYTLSGTEVRVRGTIDAPLISVVQN
ncbi:hypothetical protein COV19_05185 [Candidatus Woesearchaeota archaeon CG10_big_fil_rev_8_21_14_0_10_44_13]|nr:MAG: hypothetical protein COV19_05185 [Candidatus Woesearchaeota archaeon CG10_big_fil_rev_8_21_14_0_10_44_13]